MKASSGKAEPARDATVLEPEAGTLAEELAWAAQCRPGCGMCRRACSQQYRGVDLQWYPIQPRTLKRLQALPNHA